jgi:hypothetical protein
MTGAPIDVTRTENDSEKPGPAIQRGGKSPQAIRHPQGWGAFLRPYIVRSLLVSLIGL